MEIAAVICNAIERDVLLEIAVSDNETSGCELLSLIVRSLDRRFEDILMLSYHAVFGILAEIVEKRLEEQREYHDDAREEDAEKHRNIAGNVLEEHSHAVAEHYRNLCIELESLFALTPFEVAAEEFQRRETEL